GCTTTERSTAPRCIHSWRASTPTLCAGSATNTNDCAPPRKPRPAGSASPASIPGSSPTGHGCTVPGGKDDKSPVTRDCHAGICGSRRGRTPPATRQFEPDETAVETYRSTGSVPGWQNLSTSLKVGLDSQSPGVM